MSYDMFLGSKHFSYTWNVGPMWYACYKEKGIREIYGLTGREALVKLQTLRDFMELNQAALCKMEPDNGWGSFEGALTFVNKLITACHQHPEEIWEGD